MTTTKTPIPEMQKLHQEAVERRCRAFRAFNEIEPQYQQAQRELAMAKEAEAKTVAELTTSIAIRTNY